MEKMLWGKEENTGYRHFLLFPTVFSRGFLLQVVEAWDHQVIGSFHRKTWEDGVTILERGLTATGRKKSAVEKGLVQGHTRLRKKSL